MILQILFACASQDTSSAYLTRNLQIAHSIYRKIDELDAEARIPRNYSRDVGSYYIEKDKLLWIVQSEGVDFAFRPHDGSFIYISDNRPPHAPRQMRKAPLSVEDCRDKAVDWLALAGVPGQIVFRGSPGVIEDSQVRVEAQKCSFEALQSINGFHSRVPVKVAISRESGQLERMSFTVPVMTQFKEAALVSSEDARIAAIEAYSSWRPFREATFSFLGRQLGYPQFYTAHNFNQEDTEQIKRKMGVPFYTLMFRNLDFKGEAYGTTCQVIEVNALTGVASSVFAVPNIPVLGASSAGSIAEKPLEWDRQKPWEARLGEATGTVTPLSSKEDFEQAEALVLARGDHLIACQIRGDVIRWENGDRTFSYGRLDSNLLAEFNRMEMKRVSPFIETIKGS